MGTFWQTYRSTKRLIDHQFERLEERRAREAQFRRELADMDSAAQAAVLTRVYRKQLVRWIVAALLICPIMLAARWPSGLIVVGLFAWRIYRLIARRKAEEEKQRLIAEFVPLLNTFRLLLVQYPIDGFSEDMRAGLECRISGFCQLMRRFGVQDDGLSPAEVVASYQFRPEGFLAMKPKTVKRLFCAELPRLIFTEADRVDVLTPERFHSLVDDAREGLAAAYEAGLVGQGRIIFGHVVPIPGVCDLPPGMPVGLEPADRHRFRHTYKLGKPDSGKSHDLANADLQDLDKGMGKVVISHEREYFDQRLLPRFPAHRVDDLIWFDPADVTPPVIGFNPFRLEPGEDLHLKAGELYAVLERAMGDLGVTMRTILLNICYALLQTPEANITHLPLLLHPDDPAFRRRVLAVPTLDESTREFWERYDTSRYYQASHEAVLNRLAPFFRPPLSITLSTPSFSCHREFNEHSRALFCNLSRLRGPAQELVGQFIIAQLRETFQARDHTQTPDQWRPTFVTIDEFHKYSSSEPALEDLLTGVRKFKVGLTMAHQTTASISARLCSTILGTVETVACFRISADEAHHIARELQVVERRAHGQDEEIAAIEEAIGHERRRLRQLQAADSSVLHGLYADLQRARRALLMSGHDEPTVRLRADLLQNLEQGHQLIFGLPPFQQVVSLQAPAEPPGLSAPYQGGPTDLIALSKERYGIKRPEPPSTGPDEPAEEDYWVTR